MEDRKTTLEPYHETASDEENQRESESDNSVFFHAKLL